MHAQSRHHTTPASRSASRVIALALAILAGSPHVAAAADRHIAVLEFRGKASSADALAKMADEARAGALDALSESGIVVITRESMKVLLDKMGGRCEEGECEVETARNIGAEYVVTGELLHLEGTLLATLKLHETTRGALLATRNIEATTELDLVRKLSWATSEMLRAGLRLGAAAPRASSTLPSVGVVNTPAPAPDFEVSSAREVAVQFESDPAGAVVRVDGQLLCQATPCSKRVFAGAHRIVMERERYAPAAIAIQAERGSKVSLTLQPLFGWLSITTSQPDLKIEVRGNADSGTAELRTPVIDSMQDPGSYTVDLRDPCYQPTSATVQVVQGGHASVVLKATPRLSAIKVLATDATGNDLDGDVLVDGAAIGSTGAFYKVPTCSQRVAIHAAGGLRWSTPVSLRENEQTVINAVVTAGSESQTDESNAWYRPPRRPLSWDFGAATGYNAPSGYGGVETELRFPSALALGAEAGRGSLGWRFSPRMRAYLDDKLFFEMGGSYNTGVDEVDLLGGVSSSGPVVTMNFGFGFRIHVPPKLYYTVRFGYIAGVTKNARIHMPVSDESAAGPLYGSMAFGLGIP